MKTSNKLFIAAILIIIASMVAFDFALRAEYLKGNYKSRFYGFEKLDFRDFNVLDNKAANLISVQIEYGKNYAVYVKTNLKNKIQVSKREDKLILNVSDLKNPNLNPYEDAMIIVSPEINQVITSPLLYKEKTGDFYYSTGNLTVKGFNVQNLYLQINNLTDLSLEKNKITNLQASVGDKLSENASLVIHSNNQINNASIKVLGENHLNIQNPQIAKTNFDFSDKAEVTVKGSFFNQIKK